ncbi:MAG: TlpA family protein disulfide reductase [Thioalkalivibrio sp.]|nr:TlpA family protein disulfide reductase [Thioalkalivibrio sp.]
MIRNRPGLLVGAVVLTTAALALSACSDGDPETNATGANSANAAAEPAGAREQRIDFTLPDLGGTERRLSEWDGDLVLLNFWATWCPPCKKEMPLFQDTFETHREAGFTVVAVAIDDQDATRNFVDQYGIGFPVLIGQDDAMEIGREYGNRIGALPYSVLIDRDGTILETHRGEVESSDLESWLQTHL